MGSAGILYHEEVGLFYFLRNDESEKNIRSIKENNMQDFCPIFLLLLQLTILAIYK